MEGYRALATISSPSTRPEPIQDRDFFQSQRLCGA